MKKPNIKLRTILYITTLLIGILVCTFGFQNYEKIQLETTEQKNINYKVYLKENDFFEEPYLEEGRTYITSLIDHIDVDFHYLEQFNQASNTELRYFIQATISADTTNKEKGSYWTKDYQLTEPKQVAITDSDNIKIDTSVTINYQEFNDTLQAFSKQYPIATEGTLVIKLIIENSIKSDIFKDPLDTSSEISMSIPLLAKAVNAKIDTDTSSNTKQYEATIQNKPILHYILFIIGIITILFSTAKLSILLLEKLNWNKTHQYLIEKEKILNENDSIITNIINKPSFAGLKKYEVGSFEELLDAYSELHAPINFHENSLKTKSTFFIISQDTVWIYILQKKSKGKKNVKEA